VNFSISPEENRKISDWLEGLDAKLAAEQLQNPSTAPLVFMDDGRAYPYYGAVGCCLTYSFTPTSLGLSTVVTWCQGTKLEASLDLTDYSTW
jgi:hypothetical protein